MKALLSFPDDVSLSQSPRRGHTRYLNSLRTDDIPGARYRPRDTSSHRPTYSLVTRDIGAVPRNKGLGKSRDTLGVEDILGAHAKGFRRMRREVQGWPRDQVGGLLAQVTERTVLPPINQSMALYVVCSPSPTYVKSKRYEYSPDSRIKPL